MMGHDFGYTRVLPVREPPNKVALQTNESSVISLLKISFASFLKLYLKSQDTLFFFSFFKCVIFIAPVHAAVTCLVAVVVVWTGLVL